MLKKILPILTLPLLLAGCTTTFNITNLSSSSQPRNTNNLYMVEVAADSHQQSLRWDSIRPQIMVGHESYPMRPTLLMSNRWEGLIPIPAGTSSVQYRYKFEFQYNSFGAPGNDSSLSPQYTLRITE